MTDQAQGRERVTLRMTGSERAERLARQFHETYERLAPNYNYKTRDESAVPWEKVPVENRMLMCATAAEILRTFTPESEYEPIEADRVRMAEAYQAARSELRELRELVRRALEGDDPEKWNPDARAALATTPEPDSKVGAVTADRSKVGDGPDLAAEPPERCPTCGSDDPAICDFIAPNKIPTYQSEPHEWGSIETTDCCPDPFHSPDWLDGYETAKAEYVNEGDAVSRAELERDSYKSELRELREAADYYRQRGHPNEELWDSEDFKAWERLCRALATTPEPDSKVGAVTADRSKVGDGPDLAVEPPERVRLDLPRDEAEALLEKASPAAGPTDQHPQANCDCSPDCRAVSKLWDALHPDDPFSEPPERCRAGGCLYLDECPKGCRSVTPHSPDSDG